MALADPAKKSLVVVYDEPQWPHSSTSNPSSLYTYGQQANSSQHSRVLLASRLRSVSFTTTAPTLTLKLFTSSLRISFSAAGSAFEACSIKPSHTQNTFHLTCISQRRGYAKKRMPPKKAVEEKKVLLGRPGNSLKSGIVCRDNLYPDINQK